MKVTQQIEEYILCQVKPKSVEMQTLHELIIHVMPACKLWFMDGTNNDGKIVANPNIGYGFYTIKYANGTTRDFYRIGLSANTTGISVYILGLKDKNYLSDTLKIISEKQV